MRRAITHHAAGSWRLDAQVATVSLTHDERHRRRIRLTDDTGDPFLLDLSEAVRMADGDGLELDGGGFIAIRAKAEAVADLHCGSAEHAARIAWHIGNRHTPAEIRTGGVIRIADDHVLIDMAQGLGAKAIRHVAPFNPESGAYADGQGHGHEQGGDHGHDH
jgi:urease accessory protein